MIRCETCRHFERDAINPEAGVGACMIGLPAWHPMAMHRCDDHKEARRVDATDAP